MYFHCYNSNIHLKILPDLAQSKVACLFLFLYFLLHLFRKELILKIFLMFEDEQRFVFFKLVSFDL